MPDRLLLLDDDVLVRILSNLGDTLTFEDACQCDLVAASQVCRRFRSLVFSHLVTRVNIRQPHMTTKYTQTLGDLPLHRLPFLTTVDITYCLDWVQHPSLAALVDIPSLVGLTQLATLLLRPPTDDIDLPTNSRIKRHSEVLCWADGLMPRIWDRWMYGYAPGIPGIPNISALTNLTALEELIFPVSERRSEEPLARVHAVSVLPRLRRLALGRARVTDVCLSGFNAATTLTALSLGNCAGVTGAGLHALASLESLVELSLHNCCGMALDSGRGWEHLCALKNLRGLALYGRQEGENVHFLNVLDAQPHAVPLRADGAHRSNPLYVF